MDNFNAVVEWLSVGGSIAIVSWLVSWLFEDYDWWNNIKPQFKKLLMLGVAVVIGITAKFLQLNEEALALVRPYLDTFILICGAWVATQVAHKADKASNTDKA